jgi:hypothetical protein
MKILDIEINPYDSVEEIKKVLKEDILEKFSKICLLTTSKKKAVLMLENRLSDSTRIFYWKKETYEGKEYFALHEILYD